MIVTEGGRWGGFGLYLLKGKPVFDYNVLMLAQFRWEGQQPLAAGKHTIVFDFTYDGPGIAKGGTGVLKVDGQEVATLKIPKTIPFLLPADETFDVGVDTRTGGERPGLPGAVPLQRHDRQADRQARSGAIRRGRPKAHPARARSSRRLAERLLIGPMCAWRRPKNRERYGFVVALSGCHHRGSHWRLP